MATSSSDAIRPISASDPDAVAVPPVPGGRRRDPEPYGPSALDEAVGEPPPLADSASGEAAIGSGSATFDVPAGLIHADPIVQALSESSPDGSPPVFREPEPPAAPRSAISSSTVSPDPLDAFRLDDAAPSRPTAGGKPSPAGGASRDEVVIEYVNGPHWPMVVLASYASAVTLALIWWVVVPRLRGRSDIDTVSAPTPAAVDTPRADRSRKVEPVEPIPADRITTLRKPLVVGSLEVTPLAVERTGVKLRRTSLSGKSEVKDGGSGARALRLRLRNTSGDSAFAPLERAAVRDGDDGLCGSFVELDGGERVYLYPLAVDSEWSIAGQDFPELKPGEAKETRVFTAADFPATSSGTTWRLKLRTGLKDSAIVGVEVPGTDH
ncbi:MAG TPA: hypothetical protein VGH33_09945 [Isosphaeraceae bacterium]|jgi:hypothetical protein